MRLLFFVILLVNVQTVHAAYYNFTVAFSRPYDNSSIIPIYENDSIVPRGSVIKALVIPAALIGYGVLTIGIKGLKKLDRDTKEEITEDHPHFITHADNYLQYSPAAAVYILNAFGVMGKNNLRDRTIIYALSNLISTVFVLPLKNLTKIQRPDGSGFNSFPSGHTTTAFAAAEFLRLEYKDRSPWYGIAGYTVAAATGVLRLYNNKHWMSDIIAGAGFGILSTKLAYWIYPVIKKKFFKSGPVNTMAVPYYQQGSFGFALVKQFGR